MKILFFLLLQVSLLLAKGYEVDVAHSKVEFKVRHMLFLHTEGTFDTFSGRYEYDDETKELSALEGEVQVDSVSTQEKSRDDYLKSEAFFDSKKYPKFYLKYIEKGRVKLTIKDVSREVPFKMEFLDVMKNL